MFLTVLQMPIVFSFCNSLSFWAWVRGLECRIASHSTAPPYASRSNSAPPSLQRATGKDSEGTNAGSNAGTSAPSLPSTGFKRRRLSRRPRGWGEKPLMTVSLMSTSGANKSAMLADLQLYVEDACEYQGMPPMIATDYTVESVMAMMGDNDGTALLLLDEMKKIKATDEYKSGKQGSGNEKLMELQSGIKFRQIRKGGARAAPDEDSAASPDERRSVHVIEAQSHLNISGCTHIHTGTAWFQVRVGARSHTSLQFFHCDEVPSHCCGALCCSAGRARIY